LPVNVRLVSEHGVLLRGQAIERVVGIKKAARGNPSRKKPNSLQKTVGYSSRSFRRIIIFGLKRKPFMLLQFSQQRNKWNDSRLIGVELEYQRAGFGHLHFTTYLQNVFYETEF